MQINAKSLSNDWKRTMIKSTTKGKRSDNMKHKMTATAMVLVGTMAMATAVQAATTYTATPSSQAVTLNGESIDFAAYNIEGNNYFKLRDLAIAMDGTDKEFDVTYNKEVNAVEIISDTAYSTEYTGMSTMDSSSNKQAINSPQSVYLDGNIENLTAYSVEDNNYSKLRDVAELLDFAVDWNANTNTINIATDRTLAESITVAKEEVVVEETTSNVDITTQQAIDDIYKAIGPDSASYKFVSDADEEDWNQLLNDPYSSSKLSVYFDEYKKYGVLDGFKTSISSWLQNGGDDGVAHGTVY